MNNLNPLFEAPQTLMTVTQQLAGKNAGRMIPVNVGKVSSKGMRKLGAMRKSSHYVQGQQGSYFTPQQVNAMNTKEAIQQRLSGKNALSAYPRSY